MVWPILLLIPISFVVSVLLTLAVRKVAPRLNFVDKPGGRKEHVKVTPLGGGVAIFWAVTLPLLAALLAVPLLPHHQVAHLLAEADFAALQSGVAQQRPVALVILGGLLAMHVLGLVDDRRALGPYSKLIGQLGITTAVVLLADLRVLTAAGPVVSAVLTVLWIATITNALNFLDNMDGLSAGIAAVAATAFLITTLSIGQWFIAAALALLLGACLGFLCFNFAPASIFMGDSGSLVLGFLLGVLTVRTTFLPAGETLVSSWYTLFAPVIVLAVPLYDLTVVSLIRIASGKSPLKGDTNHFSHRLVRRGMTKRGAVLCIYLITAATALAAVVLPQVHSALAAIGLFVQTLLILAVIFVLERGPNTIVWSPPSTPSSTPPPSPVRAERDVGGAV